MLVAHEIYVLHSKDLNVVWVECGLHVHHLMGTVYYGTTGQEDVSLLRYILRQQISACHGLHIVTDKTALTAFIMHFHQPLMSLII